MGVIEMYPLSNEDIKDLEAIFLQREKALQNSSSTQTLEKIESEKKEKAEKKSISKDKKMLLAKKKKSSLETKEDINYLKNEIRKREEKINKLNQKIFELSHEIEIQKKQIFTPSRLELFLEIALNALSSFVASKENKKVLFSKNFRKSFIASLAQKPFLFDAFIKSLGNLEEHSKALSENIYIMEIPSYYGDYAALYTYLEKDTIKFLKFGTKEEILENYDILDISL